MHTLAEAPWWGSGLFTLGGVVLTGIIALLIQRSVHEANRIKEKYARLREAYASFASASGRYARAAPDYWNQAFTDRRMHERTTEPRLASESREQREERIQRLESIQLRRQEAASAIDDLLWRFESAALFLLAIDDNQERQRQIRERENSLFAIRDSLEQISDEMHELVKTETIAARDWVLEVFSSLEQEEAQSRAEIWKLA